MNKNIMHQKVIFQIHQLGKFLKDYFSIRSLGQRVVLEKLFGVAFVIQFLLTIVIGIASILALCTSGIFSVTPNNVTWAVSHITFLTWLIELILFILLVWIKLGLLGYAVRRLHDANYSGWWLWLIIIPFGWIIVVIFLLLPTVEEPVRWGSYLFVD